MTPPEITVRQVMDVTPVTVTPDATVQHVLGLMNQRRIGSVLIVKDGLRLAGIFTERDLLKRVATAVPGWRDYPVSEWMTEKPHTIEPDVGWDEAVGRMQKLRVRHLPVIENGEVIGIISTRLLMSRRAEYLNHQIAARTAELRTAFDQLMVRDSEMLHNLRTAGRLQTKVLLPQAAPDWPELKWAIHYAPLDHLGGDYYDFANPDPDHLGFLIADASGHSIPAALVAIMARFAFVEAAVQKSKPGEVMGVMNARLQELTDERFVTAFYGVFERHTQLFRYATAGHPYPLLFESKTGTVKQLTGQGFLLGVMPSEIYSEREVKLEPGDKICFYTDGVIEARNEIGEMFNVRRLTECLKEQGTQTSGMILRSILQALREFCDGTPYGDDVTLAVVDIVAA